MASPNDNYAVHDRGETAVRFWNKDYELIAQTRQVLGASTFKETCLLSLRHQLATARPLVQDDEADDRFASELLLKTATTHEEAYGREDLLALLSTLVATLNRARGDPDGGEARIAYATEQLEEVLLWEAPRQATLEIDP